MNDEISENDGNNDADEVDGTDMTEDLQVNRRTTLKTISPIVQTVRRGQLLRCRLLRFEYNVKSRSSRKTLRIV